MTDNLLSLYSQHDPNALELLGGDPFNKQYAKNLFATLLQRQLPEELRSALLHTNSELGPSKHREHSLKEVANGQPLFVVTGQQVGLFGGPLFVYYKALTAILFADRLTREFSHPVIPLFWLQTEDHNFAEVRSADLISAGGELVSLELPDEERSQKRVSVQAKILSSHIDPLVAQLEEALTGLPHSQEFVPLCRRHYTPGASYSSAFRSLLAELFADTPLLFFDPSSSYLHRAKADLFRQSIEQMPEVDTLLADQSNKLGQSVQVKHSPGSPLLFIHPSGPAGPRYRLLPTKPDHASGSSDVTSSSWSIPDLRTEYSYNDLMTLLDEQPDHFSSSALLRPILQNKLIPTLAQVVGPAELNYLAQITPLYPLFGCSAPMILPRATFLLIEDKTQRYLGSLKLSVEEASSLSPTSLQTLVVERADGKAVAPSILYRNFEDGFAELFTPLEQSINATDPTLSTVTKKTRQNILHQVSVLTEKYNRALAAGDTVRQQRLSLLVNTLLQPRGRAQERVISPLYFLSRYGRHHFENLIRSSIVEQFERNELFTNPKALRISFTATAE